MALINALKDIVNRLFPSLRDRLLDDLRASLRRHKFSALLTALASKLDCGFIFPGLRAIVFRLFARGDAHDFNSCPDHIGEATARLMSVFATMASGAVGLRALQ
jgi:hypothetical protein